MHIRDTDREPDRLGKAVTIADQVFVRLQRAIVAGEIPSGSKISEPELARVYGISRGPLREAIARLEACSLVVRKPNIGARVVTLSGAQLVEIFHVREVLEGLAARLAATAMTDAEIENLTRLLECHGTQLEQERGAADFHKEGDLDFHYRIAQGSHNARLHELLCNGLYHLVRLYRHQFGMPCTRVSQAIAEHRHIVAALANRDGEMAELLMRHHVRASRASVEHQLAALASPAGRD
jgi:DNA-binding GntR family transcriptional regulator